MTAKTVKNAPSITPEQQSDIDFLNGIKEKIANRFFRGQFAETRDLGAFLDKIKELGFWGEMVVLFTPRVDKKDLKKVKAKAA